MGHYKLRLLIVDDSKLNSRNFVNKQKTHFLKISYLNSKSRLIRLPDGLLLQLNLVPEDLSTNKGRIFLKLNSNVFKSSLSTELITMATN